MEVAATVSVFFLLKNSSMFTNSYLNYCTLCVTNYVNTKYDTDIISRPGVFMEILDQACLLRNQPWVCIQSITVFCCICCYNGISFYVKWYTTILQHFWVGNHRACISMAHGQCSGRKTAYRIVTAIITINFISLEVVLFLSTT